MDRFEVKGVVGEPKRSQVKSVLMRHVLTGHIQYYSQGVYRRWQWEHATRVSSHRLQRDENHNGTDTAKIT
jgi:hypothetical protein